ncbi:hypothetical protein D0869_10409 [Hortaea werneckii]|uniref:F-box domain-containing protein n=1 Tax=Hortaea werneckii TaxID=91943 RepID=A0A3M6Z7Y4_HORWE|nr:hypothetical protein KC334_g5770 [Hortaea werneckii]KAI7006781.1 hypothetical protein KC355_g7601 [Hortaea werneckii]KAI7155927.1 hypothetical protein KC324_g14197 [Hortaea werneckii]KAI7581116.1 hypothetical protein KC316_g8606 [Hortaea werneckii]KAI7661060.1 hypothetical protein KC318_g9696 [Hortaea werneckii]
MCSTPPGAGHATAAEPPLIADGEGREVLHQSVGEEASSGLMKLPPELRNEIYELVLFQEDDDEDYEPIDLMYPYPPSKNLLLSCREIYHEAKGIYKQAYRAFWKTSTFMVEDVSDMPETMVGLQRKLREKEVELIHHLTMYDGDNGKLVYSEGMWTEYGPETEEEDGEKILIEPAGELAKQPLQDMPDAVSFDMEPFGKEGAVWKVHLSQGLDDEDQVKLKKAAKGKLLGLAELWGAVQYCRGH